MGGQQAVLSALGARTHGRTTVLSEGTKNVIRAMERQGVRRFVCESSLGVGDSRGQLGLLFDWIVLPLWLRHVYRDKEVQERDIKQSHLDWVIVRPALLTNGPRTGVYQVGLKYNRSSIVPQISRADVADFMLKQLTDDTYLRQARDCGTDGSCLGCQPIVQPQAGDVPVVGRIVRYQRQVVDYGHGCDHPVGGRNLDAAAE